MKKHLILCPVDYSGSTEPAISLAVDLAKVNSSKVVLLHVIDPGESPITVAEDHAHQFQERIRDHYLDLNDIDYEHLTRRGNPADVTIDYVNKHGADLIVMGTHGRTGLASLVVGSVAKKVMAQASCPVVTVKLPALSATK